MTNVKFNRIEDYRDIDSLNLYRQEVLERGRSANEMLTMIHAKGRDNARTPMQWDASSSAGFTTHQPWIAVNPNHTEINVEQSLHDPNSIFWHYRKLFNCAASTPFLFMDALICCSPNIRRSLPTHAATSSSKCWSCSIFAPTNQVLISCRIPSTRLLLSNLPVPENFNWHDQPSTF